MILIVTDISSDVLLSLVFQFADRWRLVVEILIQLKTEIYSRKIKQFHLLIDLSHFKSSSNQD